MKTERIDPGPGQESVWDYPRPPRLERCEKRIEIIFNDVVVADTVGAYRVLETSHPPNYYLPRADVRDDAIVESMRTSFCEWKGSARYASIRVGSRVADAAAWFYPQPTAGFEPIRDYLAFYAAVMDVCRVDGETVTPQPGGFYGGWITSDVVGPFKGARGTEFW